MAKKFEYIKSKTFSSTEDSIDKGSRQITVGRRYMQCLKLTKFLTIQKLTSLQLKKNSSEKMGKDMFRQFTEKETQGPSYMEMSKLIRRKQEDRERK